MTTETAARQPRGIPVGGQFAATTHAEPSARLSVSQPVPGGVEERLSSVVKERQSREESVHQRSHKGLTGNGLSSAAEASIAREAIHHGLISGEFGKDTLKVRELARDERLIRHAVDRYVATDQQEPGALDPEDTGHRLGRILIDLQDEDIEDAVYAIEGESA